MGNRVLYMTLRGEKIFDRMANYSVDWPEGGYIDSITGIKYMVSGDEGRRRIGPVDGTYKHPSTGETVAVKDGKIEGASLHTVILTVDKLDGRIARLTSQEYDASIVR